MTNYRRRRKPVRKQEVRYVVNERIRHPEVRVVDEEGFVGIMSNREALKVAEERELDLVEINPKANPPIVKIMDFSKFKYIQSKSENNKKTVIDKVKTIRVSVRIGPHDLAVQVKKAQEFLEKGYQVKVQVQMRGREKAHPEVAKEVMDSFIHLVEIPFAFVAEPKLVSDSCFATLRPNK